MYCKLYKISEINIIKFSILYNPKKLNNKREAKKIKNKKNLF